MALDVEDALSVTAESTDSELCEMTAAFACVGVIGEPSWQKGCVGLEQVKALSLEGEDFMMPMPWVPESEGGSWWESI